MNDPRRERITKWADNPLVLGLSPPSTPYWYTYNVLKIARTNENFLHGFPRHCATIPAVLLLHACFDSTLNETLAFSRLFAEKNNNFALCDNIDSIQNLSLSRKSKKIKKFISIYDIDETPLDNVIKDINLFCDLRDIFFHTDPRFENIGSIPQVAVEVANTLNIIFEKTHWRNSLSDPKVLDWSESLFRNFFSEFDMLAGREDHIIRSLDEMWSNVYAKMFA